MAASSVADPQTHPKLAAGMGTTKWKPGQSGNPAGRPKGCVGLAGYVREHTHDGKKLVNLLVRIAECETESLDKHKVTLDHRLEAIRILLNRGFGRPVEQVVLGGGAATLTDVIMQHFQAKQVEQAAESMQESLKDAGKPDESRDSQAENAKRGEGAASS